jgi:hypothetical protein
MKIKVMVPMLIIASASLALAQAQSGGQTPIGAHVISASTPAAMPSPDTIPGGLYRLGNGYLTCPGSAPLTNGQPNLRSCVYVKGFVLRNVEKFGDAGWRGVYCPLIKNDGRGQFPCRHPGSECQGPSQRLLLILFRREILSRENLRLMKKGRLQWLPC